MPFLIEHDDSLFTDQLKKLCGKSFLEGSQTRKVKNIRIPQVILVKAKKNQKQKKQITKLISDGFKYNGNHFVRYGKSGSQGKDGVTLFVEESVYEDLFFISQLGIDVKECVVSKYESQRCLTLSTCNLVNERLPYIVIVDEYMSILPQQKIRYVEEVVEEIVDRETKETKTIKTRKVKDGYKDINLSPFDGCGCHDKALSNIWSNAIGLEDYTAIGYQIRLPFFKGFSVEVPFKEYYKSIDVDTIVDVCGNSHKVEDIDCIWNTSMWKGFGIFKAEYGLKNAWDEYVGAINKFGYKLGLSKYSHHKKNFNLKTRMNFQYLQCLDLWNPKYINWFTKRPLEPYNILDSSNWGNMIRLAKYTTDLYEKIIKGDKFYTCKFLGLQDTNNTYDGSNYVKAILKNDIMLKDPAVKRFVYLKLKKSIEQAKYAKIYSDGYYHTVVGDMIGYLEFVAGRDVKGCLCSGEFYCDTIPKGKTLSFRSPLVCPSEVNEVNVVSNLMTERWFSHFKDQDVVMINMYDLSMPQQGGMDCDGDAVFLCHDPLLKDTKIYKDMIIDIDDKITAQVKPYNKESIIEYEMASRDNRIGEITNVATSIINQYTTDKKWKKINDDNISLLRIFQGKEIDYQKTGLRWQMNSGLRKYIKRLPYFLLYNYPEKLKRYGNLRRKNKQIEKIEDKLPLNAYQSPSPLNELCDYIITWEKKKVLWDNSCINTSCLIVDNTLELNDKTIIKQIKHKITDFSSRLRKSLEAIDDGEDIDIKILIENFEGELNDIVPGDRNLLANYVIKTSYLNMSTSKSLAWNLYADIILKNLDKNTPQSKHTKIIEVPYRTESSYEYLGKHYEMLDGEDFV